MSLAPRGRGRGTLRLSELVSANLIPVIVYDDEPFIPYPHLFAQFGWATNLEGLRDTISNVGNASYAELNQRWHVLNKLRESHFSLKGMFDQIFSFLNGYESDLVCSQPSSFPASASSLLAVRKC